jgi:lipid-A-disaccharide synthase-like uncharacterized protein
MITFAVISLFAHAFIISYYLWKADFGMVLAYTSGVIWILAYLQDVAKDKT